MFAISKPITRLSLLLIFLFGPLCEEQGGRQNRPSSYADVVGKYREDFHIKVKKMFVGKLALTSNPWGRPKWVWLKLKLTLKGDFCEVSVTAFFANFSSCTALSDTWMSIFSHFPSKTPKVRLQSTNDEHPRHFCVGVPPRKQITPSVPLNFGKVNDYCLLRVLYWLCFTQFRLGWMAGFMVTSNGVLLTFVYFYQLGETAWTSTLYLLTFTKLHDSKLMLKLYYLRVQTSLLISCDTNVALDSGLSLGEWNLKLTTPNWKKKSEEETF